MDIRDIEVRLSELETDLPESEGMLLEAIHNQHKECNRRIASLEERLNSLEREARAKQIQEALAKARRPFLHQPLLPSFEPLPRPRWPWER